MAKENKRFRRKGKNVGPRNAEMKRVHTQVSRAKDIVPSSSAPPTNVAEATANDPQSKSNVGASQGPEKQGERAKRVAGFIFMCNPSTKSDCYQYRVFGLPSGKKELVEEIKPGAKLFLFDFELKLLYGIYEATSAGKMNLEPAAFRGKFPAQVKFKIFKECIPLHESFVKGVIKENYTGTKFKQELSGKQVKKLLSSFRPLTTSSSRPAPHPPANVPLARSMPPAATENQFQHTGRQLLSQGPYLAEMQYGRIPPAPQVNILPHGYHRAGAYVDRVNPTLDHRSLSGTNTHHFQNPQQPPGTNTLVHGVQEPTYSRYRTVEEHAPAQITSLERRFRTGEGRAPHDQVTLMERQYREFPSWREGSYQENIAAYNPNRNQPAPFQYTSSVTQPQPQPQPRPQVPAPYHHLHLQRGTQYQDHAVAYNSNPAAPTQYTAPVSQPQLQATYHQLPLPSLYRDNVAAYNSYPAAPAHNIPSVAHQPQAPAPRMPQGSAPVSSYYQHAMANRYNR